MIFDNFWKTLIILMAVGISLFQQRLLPKVEIRKVCIFVVNFFVLSVIINFTTMLVIAIISLICFFVARSIQLSQRQNTYPLSENATLVSMTVLLLLFFFLVLKYHWARSLVSLTYLSDLTRNISLIQTVGVSYLLFKLIHFVVDSSRDLLPPLDLVTFFDYIFFFPTFLSGPIERYQNFHKQLNHLSQKQTPLLSWASLYRLFIGAAKKFALVPLIMKYALNFNNVDISNIQIVNIFVSLVAYSFYIYLDFSGYSDLAIGTGMLLGFRLPENFRNPYFSSNISEFWRRWHISLSSILKDYIFLPTVRFISKQQIDLPRITVSIIGYILTFFICGLWHGSSLNFVLWGLWHGVGLSIYSIWKNASLYKKIQNTRGLSQIAIHLISVAITFSFVTVGWLFFNYSPDKIFAMFIWSV